jgi:hypothetical protein
MVCQFCGRATEIRLGDLAICEECYQAAGSCCPEFGAADLWGARGQEPAADADGSPPREVPPADRSAVGPAR